MWFNKKDINIKKPIIIIDDLNGYVLPHAGTAHSGEVISHTLRFKPKKKFNNILILFYPANPSENVTTIKPPMYHEEYVVKKSLMHVIKNVWKIKTPIQFLSYNVRDKQGNQNVNIVDTLIIVSADFSHHLPMQTALHLENCAAHSIMYKDIYSNINKKCLDVIDHVDSFKKMYDDILPNGNLQWIGRSRSVGKKGVGYLSFLIREPATPINLPPDGLFVTVYDEKMNSRECLGQWYKKNNIWSLHKETIFIKDVLHKAKTTSRLTNGKFLNIPITNYTITYLYLSKNKKHNFIRGYHGILGAAFYLPGVFLENTYENGIWIKPDDVSWKKTNYTKTPTRFNLNQTFKKLNVKGNSLHKTKKNKKLNYKLYKTHVIHKNV